MPSSTKRSSVDSDDDDDSDDDLLTSSVFGPSRAEKRRNARNEAAKKKQRLAQMNALLDNGRVKLERENRMDKLCQENNDLMRDESLDKKKDDKSNAEDESGTDGNSAMHREKSVKGLANSSVQRENQDYQPTDSKETFCLGSRNTLQFVRVLSIDRGDETLSLDANDKEPRAFTPVWFGFEQAVTDLRTVLLADQQIQQRRCSFTSLRDELLNLCTNKTPYACRTYLKERLMSKPDKHERVRRIPVNVLRWFMSLACGPVSNGKMNGVSSNNQNRTANTNKKQETKQDMRQTSQSKGKENHSSRTTDMVVSQRLLREAQMGAFQTLRQLWLQNLGSPLQQQQQPNEIYFLSISALPRQLCQWFGSSISFETAIGNSDKSSKVTNSLDENKRDQVRVTSSHAALTRFLDLWALGLQKQNESENTEDNVHLIQFHYDEENRTGFRKHISDAIIAVLWAGLNPCFASSRSSKNDGNRSIQTIVACLLDRVRQEDRCYSDRNGNDHNVESFEEWLQILSERIRTIWSTQLGRGQMGTDAYEDEYAWLCLARSVTRLVLIGGIEYQKIGGMYGGIECDDHRERAIVSTLKDFQLSLCRCILKHAFRGDENSYLIEDMRKGLVENRNNNGGDSFDWVSHFVDEEIRRMMVPPDIRSYQRWQAIALAVVGLSKLASSFPEEEASKCFALMDVCTVCFQLAIVELEHEIQKGCQEETKDGFDDDDDFLVTNENTMSIASNKNAKDSVLEKYALYNAFVRLENASEIISNKTRVLIMRNICFPWASHMAESLRNYARSQKELYAPPSEIKTTLLKQQSKISTFFKTNKN